MKKLRYGIGEQSFSELIDGGYVYIDKTHFIEKRLENKYYFLSRPRRFGKSLFLSTLECFFTGRKELFKGLHIENFSWDWTPYPVVRIDLNGPDYLKSESLTDRIKAILMNYEQQFDLTSSFTSLSERFRQLIVNTHRKFGRQVVVLVDEYDKPLLDSLSDETLLNSHSGTLREIYSVLKSESESLRFVFLTGVTRFGHLNIFSGLNNLKDISLNDEYAAICGITQNEFLTCLKDGIEEFAISEGLSFNDCAQELKNYYDGYHFSKSLVDIYNPYSLLKCLDDKEIWNQWFVSGSSSFLLSQLRKTDYNFAELDHESASVDTLLGLDVPMTDPVTLLYQSGYLTIKDYDPENKVFTLAIPNREVKHSLYSIIIPFFLGSNKKVNHREVETIYHLFLNGEPHKAMEWLASFFSSIPYDVRLNYEKDFQIVIYSFFALMGLGQNIELEKHTSAGRIDLLVDTPDFVYIMEFKKGDSALNAIRQINDRDYAAPYISSGKKIYKIGVAFSAQTRGISEYLITE